MDRRLKKKSRLVRQFFHGQHSDNPELEEHFLDWFFLSNFGKEPGYWRMLSEDKLMALITLQNEKDKYYWDTWVKIHKEINKK